MSKSFQENLLQKLSVAQKTRLEAEAVRKKNTPRPKIEIWGDFRRSFVWQLKRDARVAGLLSVGFLCVWVGFLLAKVSAVLAVLWLSVCVFIVVYVALAMCDAVFKTVRTIYGLLTFQGSK